MTLFFIKLSFILIMIKCASTNYEKGCDQLTCKIGEQCVNRRFWCNYSPCPSMTYCSKNRKESLKGPETCESVVCAQGFKCIIQVYDCEWNQKCKQRFARCISEQRYQDGPATCIDVSCPVDHHCVLRETNCFQPPCKLSRSCARNKDVIAWHDKCKQLGCRSEHNCFLRRPSEVCSRPPCSHIPDCLVENNSDDYEYCHGWICPVNQACVAHTEAPCKNGDCVVARSCQGPVMRTDDIFHDMNEQPIEILSTRTTLNDLEREAFLNEQRKLRNSLKPTPVLNFTKLIKPAYYDEIIPTRGSLSYKNPDYETVKTKRVTNIPNMRSTYFGDSWLTYLKSKAGAETVQYWIEKAKNNEDYEEFVEWLDSVAVLLDPDTYRRWLQEVIIATADIPEFQSWISPWNIEIDEHRTTLKVPSHLPLTNTHNNNQRLAFNDKTRPTIASRSFPGSSDQGPGHNIFYRDKSLLYIQPQADSDLNYHRSLVENQPRYSSETTYPQISSFKNGGRYQRPQQPHPQQQQQQQRPNPFNFNFNEAKGFDEIPGFQHSIHSAVDASPLPTHVTPTPYLGIVQSRNLQDHDLQLQEPVQGFDQSATLPARVQEFVETVMSSWKSWQSYYQPNQPPPTFSVFPVIPTLHLQMNNFSIKTPNSEIHYQPEPLQKQQQIQKQPQQQDSRFNKQQQQQQQQLQQQEQLNQFLTQYKNAIQNSKKIDDVLPINKNNNDYEKSVLDTALEGAKAMVKQMTGSPQSNQMQPNVINLDKNQPISQILYPTETKNDENVPSLLIYFPPPLNFFIYLNQTLDEAITPKFEIPKLENAVRTIPSKRPKPKKPKKPEIKKPESDEEKEEEKESEKEPETSNQSENFDERKTLNYVRKMIRDLIHYWDDQEKNPDKPKKSNDKPTSRYMNTGKSQKDTPETKNLNTPNDNIVSTFQAFIEWMIKNNHTDILEEEQRKRKKPLLNDESDINPRSLEIDARRYSNKKLSEIFDLTNRKKNLEDSDDENSKQIRILVDVDKNPEIIKALLMNNKTNKDKDKNGDKSSPPKEDMEKVILDLKDFMDAKEEDIVARKLVQMAINQMNFNLTEDKMPKTLWVFPIYEDDENETVVDFIEKRNREMKGLGPDKDKSNSKSKAPHVEARKQTKSSRYNPPTKKKYEADHSDGENDDEQYEEVYELVPSKKNKRNRKATMRN